LHTKSKEYAISVWKHEENPDRIGINREPEELRPPETIINIAKLIS
jgi:hypothetical protein